MADNTGIRITVNSAQVLARLQAGIDTGSVNKAMYRAMSKSVIDVHKRVVAKLSGQVLNVQEDFLRGQMQWEVSPDGRTGIIGTNLEYAAIHEFGGTTPPHQIEVHDFDSALPISVAASRIATRAPAGVIFRATVQHPGAVIPERPYMRPALAEATDSIRGYVAEEVAALLRGTP